MRADPDDTDVIPARPAATVAVVRDATDGRPGVEVFMLRRTTGAAFAPGMYVFPGGRVDDVDSAEALEPFSADRDDAGASAALGIERGGLAFWVAAIRECFEEAGLLLAHRRDGADVEPVVGDRVAVHDGALSMLELCRRDDLVLDTSALRYVAHWVTPVEETARRFDTRFFLAPAPVGQIGAHDEVETIASAWLRPADALARADDGEIVLLPPTIANLEPLAGCGSVAEALARADAADPPRRIQPSVIFDDAGNTVGFSIPD